MIYKEFQGIQLSTLGMGNMRLPTVTVDPQGEIDHGKAQEIIDYAMGHGVNYYDTAYIYNDGDSERFLGRALQKYPRDSFCLATKFFIQTTPRPEPVFEEQLERLKTDHIDFYLLHSLSEENAEDYLNSGCIDYFLGQKKKGRIRYLGFSSHAGVETLKRFADHHPWDLAQLQINYFDWENEKVKAREMYDVVVKHDLPVVVMEPVRGGSLASLPEEPAGILKKADPNASIASWAVKFAASLPGVMTVLSGMSDEAQVEDNLRSFIGFNGLDEQQNKMLLDVAGILRSYPTVPCTGCKYCVDGCPMKIKIPAVISALNHQRMFGSSPVADKKYTDAVKDGGKASECIGCGACASACPQGLDIPTLMQEAASVFER